MHSVRELHEAGRIRLALARGLLVVCVFSGAFACRQTPRVAAQEDATRQPQDTLPLVAVAQNPDWQLIRDTAVGLTFWMPRAHTADWRMVNRSTKCISPDSVWLQGLAGDTPSVHFVAGKLEPNIIAGDFVYQDSGGSYHSRGRGGWGAPMHVYRGTHWIAMKGEVAYGVEIEGGGMATDWRPLLMAGVQRTPTCVAVLDLSAVANELNPAEVWWMLESMRFGAQDPARALPNQLLASSALTLADRAGVITGDDYGWCFQTNLDLPNGTPIVVVDPTSNANETTYMVATQAGRHCGASISNSRAHRLEKELDGPVLWRPVVGLVAVTDLSAVIFDACTRGDSTMLSIKTSDDKRVLWTGRVKAGEPRMMDCG